MKIMKNSGIPWIKEIPAEWETCRVSDAFYRKNRKAYQLDPTILTLARSGIKIRDISSNEGQIAESYYEYNPVAKNDLLLNPMDLQSGDNCSISKVEGVISPAYINLRYKNNISPDFYNYLFKVYYWTKALFTYGKGVSFDNRWTLNYETLSHLKIIKPKYDEQIKISNYLDKKCGEIDGLIADIEKEIEILTQYKKSIITETVTQGLNKDIKFKNTDIKWAVKIPEHWNVKKGKYCLKYIVRPVKETDDIITCFRDGEVTLRKNRREDGFTMADKEIGYQGINKGDLVVHGMDGFAGAIGISDSRGKASPVLNVLDTQENKKYIMYYLRALAFNDVFTAMSTGIRVRSCDLRWNKLAELSYILPPIEEQNQIVEYLDKTINEINSILEDKNKQLETLESYKKSIIYEYVTGKKEVK